MSISSVREYFRKLGIEDKVMEFDVSSATVELAAAALGCEGQRIGKTMAFMVDDRPILIVVAGDARIAATSPPGGWRAATSTPTARAAATTRS